MTTPDNARPRWTRAEISIAVNRAVSEIAAMAPEDDRLREVLLLAMNSSMHFLEYPDANIGDAAYAAYGDKDAAVAWIQR